jgi:hypothetical protein
MCFRRSLKEDFIPRYSSFLNSVWERRLRNSVSRLCSLNSVWGPEKTEFEDRKNQNEKVNGDTDYLLLTR